MSNNGKCGRIERFLRAACIFTRLEDDTAFARIKPRLHTLETINENSKKPHRGNPPTTQEQRPNRDMPSKRSFSAFTKHCLTCVRKSKPRSPTGPTQSAWTATMRTSVSDSISPRIFMSCQSRNTRRTGDCCFGKTTTASESTLSGLAKTSSSRTAPTGPPMRSSRPALTATWWKTLSGSPRTTIWSASCR